MNSAANTPFPNAPPTTPFQQIQQQQQQQYQQQQKSKQPPATIATTSISLSAPKPIRNPFAKKQIVNSQPTSQVATPIPINSLSGSTPNPTTNNAHTFFPSPSPIIPSRSNPTVTSNKQAQQPPLSTSAKLNTKSKKFIPPPPLPFIPSINKVPQSVSPQQSQKQHEQFATPTIQPSQIVQPNIPQEQQQTTTTPTDTSSAPAVVANEVNPASFHPNITSNKNRKTDSKPFQRKSIPPPAILSQLNNNKNRIPIPSLNLQQIQPSSTSPLNTTGSMSINRSSSSSSSMINREDMKHFCSIVKFGYRGQLLVMKPNNGRNGAVVIEQLNEVIRDNKSIVCENYFPGPLNKDTKLEELMFYIEKELNLCKPDSSWRILWYSLKYLLENKGDIDFVNHKPEELLKLLQPQKDERKRNYNNLKTIPIEEQEETLDKIEELLVDGKLHEAIELAISKELWCHALIISSSGGSKGLGNIVQRFNNHIFPKDSLLPSFYTYYSDSLSSNSNRDISHWRNLLHSFLSTNSVNSDRNLRELGDSLLLSGDFAAAHSCYIVYYNIILYYIYFPFLFFYFFYLIYIFI